MAGKRIVLLLFMAVVFHFDCLRSSNLVEANLLVTSAPMPNIDPEGASIKVQIGIAALETVLQSCPVIRQKRLPIYDPFITPASPNMTVGYWTHGDVVRAWFKPALSNNLYRMCLIASQDQLQCYDKKFVKNSNETVFTNVKAGRYYVWVSNERDNTFYSTKEFNVTGPEVEALPLSHKTIIMMGTVGCLGVIIIITVTTYVIKRRMGLHIPCCGNWLSCSKYHYQAPSLHPNNTVETELETGPAPLKVMPVTLPYCEKYQVAVDAVMKYLEEWANIEIQHMSFDEILNNCDSLPTSTVFAIFYSPQMEQVLNSSVITPPHCKPFFSADMLNSIHALFSKINQKEYSKIMITFEDLYYQDSFSLFKDTQIIQLSSDESFSTNLGNLLRLLASADLPQGWFTNPMVSDLTKKINIYRSMCVFGHAETNNHVGHCQTHSPLIHAGQRYDIENKLKMIDNRVLNTHSTIQTRLGSHSAAEKWVEEQNYLQFEVLVESVSECGDPWESPHESDNESETMTSLCRRTDQINQNYDRC
ncbi:hypothetical protein DPMN_004255 [Dreissena polymorpha]|uniref:Uncharacterized protein n=1 Tax=Dreissena polymorpha TaxID=45954 RepID=A0A9D4MMH6_DREPO|nr:hypothetical protein DPMN_004255 [Dreissena polymorpha]